jgi:translation initiation factor IF-2|tara:strand:+ start:722 stop:967 length:246 start_codon:yes stop_codon:yes gene_type:complete
MVKRKRIFQIAIDLNVTHTDILSYLKSQNIDVSSHMTPVDEIVYNMILKDKASIRRLNEERTRMDYKNIGKTKKLDSVKIL